MQIMYFISTITESSVVVTYEGRLADRLGQLLKKKDSS